MFGMQDVCLINIYARNDHNLNEQICDCFALTVYVYIDVCYLKLIKKRVVSSATSLDAFPINSSAPVVVNITMVIALILQLRLIQ